MGRDRGRRAAARAAATVAALAALTAGCADAGPDHTTAAVATTAQAPITTAAVPTTSTPITTAAVPTTSTRSTTAAVPTTSTPSATHPRWFDRVLVVVMENADAGAVLRNADFAALVAQGTRFEGYRAVAHPSEPNYLALIGGDTFVRDDGVHDLAATNLVDLLEAAGITWRAYLEGFPGGCSSVGQATGADGVRYVRKHDPFISFDDIRTAPSRCDHLVDGGRLADDLAAGTLPQYGFLVPDLVHDGHDSSIAVAGRWLRGFLEPLLADQQAMARTLVVVTYDEGSGSGDPSGQPIFTLAIGAGAAPGAVDPTPLDHYSLLRTVEENWGLGTLGRHDDTAVPLPLAG